MYLSRIKLQFNNLKPGMLEKWNSSTFYASHQWLWQLFPEQQSRQFLFRLEKHGRFFVLSATPPLPYHNLFIIETKHFHPKLEKGMELGFQLCANPVVTRNKKRSDVMMDAKYQAKKEGIPQEQWAELQQQAAQTWLEKQGDKHGFCLIESDIDDFFICAGKEYTKTSISHQYVKMYKQNHFVRKWQENPITFSSVDFSGILRITDVPLFEHILFSGLGKSKALGCGMLMIKRRIL